MVVNCAEHFESQVVNHFYAVYDFDVVSELIVNNSRILDDCGEVYVVLMTLLLIQATVIVVTA